MTGVEDDSDNAETLISNADAQQDQRPTTSAPPTTGSDKFPTLQGKAGPQTSAPAIDTSQQLDKILKQIEKCCPIHILRNIADGQDRGFRALHDDAGLARDDSVLLRDSVDTQTSSILDIMEEYCPTPLLREVVYTLAGLRIDIANNQDNIRTENASLKHSLDEFVSELRRARGSSATPTRSQRPSTEIQRLATTPAALPALDLGRPLNTTSDRGDSKDIGTPVGELHNFETFLKRMKRPS